MRKRTTPDGAPTQAQTREFEMLHDLLKATTVEMREFAKKKADEELNENKIKMINRILEPMKVLLKNQDMVAFLDMLDKTSLPTNSDAVLILGHYKAGMDQFKERYYLYDKSISGKRWITQEEPL